MRKAILVGMLLLSVFFLGGCIVISSEEHKCTKHPDIVCAPADEQM